MRSNFSELLINQTNPKINAGIVHEGSKILRAKKGRPSNKNKVFRVIKKTIVPHCISAGKDVLFCLLAVVPPDEEEREVVWELADQRPEDFVFDVRDEL